MTPCHSHILSLHVSLPILSWFLSSLQSSPADFLECVPFPAVSFPTMASGWHLLILQMVAEAPPHWRASWPPHHSLLGPPVFFLPKADHGLLWIAYPPMWVAVWLVSSPLDCQLLEDYKRHVYSALSQPSRKGQDRGLTQIFVEWTREGKNKWINGFFRLQIHDLRTLPHTKGCSCPILISVAMTFALLKQVFFP